CPVDCIPLDPNNVETKEQLMEKFVKLTAKS
ncbi:MAG: ferredoxin, partial [Betaproteobacteria bacterium HGW-Betaproteobacteria-19]